MRRPILNHTKWKGEVYNPFLGSGTTLAAAELTGRVCSGLELDPRYVDVIVTRWQALSKRKAKLAGDGRTFEEIARERASSVARNLSTETKRPSKVMDRALRSVQPSETKTAKLPTSSRIKKDRPRRAA